MKKICMGSVLILIMSLLVGCSLSNAATTSEVETLSIMQTVEETSESDEEETAESSTEYEETAEEIETVVEQTEEFSETDVQVEKSDEKEVTDFQVTTFESAKEMYVISALNVRKGPSTQFDIISHLSGGTAVTVCGQADTGWYQVKIGEKMGYVSHNYVSETPVQNQNAAPTQDSAQQTAQQSAPQATVAPAGVIMVGDSRCVQMQAAVGGGGCSWVCENSKEYTWFVETGIPRLDPYVGNGTKVVINMGVNDPEHYRQYAETINAKAAEWAGRGAKTYLVSVNPVWENPYTTQEQVDTFNANVPGMLSGVTWIDTASWLNENGCKILDGLHYDDTTYINIFNLIMGSL